MRMGDLLKLDDEERRRVANDLATGYGPPVNAKGTANLPARVHMRTTRPERESALANVMMAMDHAMPGKDGLATVLKEYAGVRGRSQIQERDALVRLAAWAMREAIAKDRIIAESRERQVA